MSMPEKTKQDKFLNGIVKLILKMRPQIWRQMYRTMHKIKENPNMPSYRAIWHNSILGMSINLHGRRTKKLTAEIRNALFKALIENKQHLTIDNYSLGTVEEKYDFAFYLTENMHYEIRKTHPNIKNTFTKIGFRDSDKYNKKHKNETAPLGRYVPSKNAITYYSHLFEYPFEELIDTIVHEYIHAMQNAGGAILPSYIIEFADNNASKKLATPYILDPSEKEAEQIANRVSHNFTKKYMKYAGKDNINAPLQYTSDNSL